MAQTLLQTAFRCFREHHLASDLSFYEGRLGQSGKWAPVRPSARLYLRSAPTEPASGFVPFG